MIRLIKRYGSRKLYDTEESRYVSLEELADWIREGQEIRVVDNKTQEEVTAQTLTQIISEEGRKGRTLLPNELLHELIRLGEKAVSSGVEHLQTKVDHLVQSSLDRIGPVRRAREEMSRLRERLEMLEGSLAELDESRRSEPPTRSPRPRASKQSSTRASGTKDTASTSSGTRSSGAKRAAKTRTSARSTGGGSGSTKADEPR